MPWADLAHGRGQGVLNTTLSLRCISDSGYCSINLGGALAGHWIYDAWAMVGLGVWSFPFLFLGGALAGLYSGAYLVDRIITIRCPQCGERMDKKGVRRSFLFTCPACGRSQYG